jgi:hypothetical protein
MHIKEPGRARRRPDQRMQGEGMQSKRRLGERSLAIHKVNTGDAKKRLFNLGSPCSGVWDCIDYVIAVIYMLSMGNTPI